MFQLFCLCELFFLRMITFLTCNISCFRMLLFLDWSLGFARLYWTRKMILRGKPTWNQVWLKKQRPLQKLLQPLLLMWQKQVKKCWIVNLKVRTTPFVFYIFFGLVIDEFQSFSLITSVFFPVREEILWGVYESVRSTSTGNEVNE